MSLVATNLVHQQLWTTVSTFEKNGYTFCEGLPPRKLHPEDSAIERETVLVTNVAETWTVAQWKQVFDTVDRRRITMAMISDDSTVVYYLVYRGLQVPRKN